MKPTKTQQRVVKILENIIEQVKDDNGVAIVYEETLDAMLHDLNVEDFFGTEGQNDPRCDRRR